MVDISILETRWELSGDEYSEGPGEYSKRPQGDLNETSTRPQKVPASTQKVPAILTRQRKKRLLRIYVRTYVITLASCRGSKISFSKILFALFFCHIPPLPILHRVFRISTNIPREHIISNKNAQHHGHQSPNSAAVSAVFHFSLI